MVARKSFHTLIYHSILAEQDWKCAVCDNPIARSQAEFDHIVPLWLGGKDTPENLAAICSICHKAKTKREAAARGKIRRIKSQDGLLKKRQNKKDRYLARREARPKWL